MTDAANCVFCRILAGQAPASFVYRDDVVVAFMAVPQAGPGHVLVVPVRHAENAYDLPEELAGPILRLALRLSRAIKSGLKPDGVSMLQNSEPGANQTVMHYHLHVIGRVAGRRLSVHNPAGQKDRAELDRLATVLSQTLEAEA
jgi:histidine triad (HIT) family protein